MFHIIEREMRWRRERGQPEGFGALRAFRPVVAVGAEDPLGDQKMLADYFREFSFPFPPPPPLPSHIYCTYTDMI